MGLQRPCGVTIAFTILEHLCKNPFYNQRQFFQPLGDYVHWKQKCVPVTV